MKNWFGYACVTFLCLSASAGDVFVSGSGCAGIGAMHWEGNDCPPFYGNSVNYNARHSPPCPDSHLIVELVGDCAVLDLHPADGWGTNDNSYVIHSDNSYDFTPYGPSTPGVQPLVNNGSTPAIIQQLSNGIPTGNYLGLPPGDSGQFTIPDVGTATWGTRLIHPANGELVGGTFTTNADGTYLLTGATLGGVPTPSPLNFASSDNPIIVTNGLQAGSPGGSVPTPSFYNPVYTSSLFTNTGTGGVAITNQEATSNLNGGAFQQGVSALYDSEKINTQGIIDQLKVNDRDNINSLSGISNLLSGQTNIGPAQTNYSSAQSMSSTYFADAATAMQSKADSISPASPSSGAAGAWTVTINSSTYNLDPLSSEGQFHLVADSASWIRLLSTWCLWTAFCIWLSSLINAQLSTVALTPQAHAAEVVPAFASGIAVACAISIVIALAASTTYCIGLLTSDFIAHVNNNPFSSGGGVIGSGIYLLNAIWDIPLNLTLLGYYIAYPIYIGRSVLVAQTVIKFLVG